MALAEKEAGNAAFKRGEFDVAIASYTRALEKEPGSHILLTNRRYYTCLCSAFMRAVTIVNLSHICCYSVSYLHLTKYQEALADADSALKICPTWMKVLSTFVKVLSHR